jgi:UDP:flavonoid glycosyltransferase YjiC (YdhE family)
VFGYIDALRAIVEGLAQLDVDVLVTVHLEGDAHGLDPLPPRVRVERFVPQAEVLEHVDAVVHHGGTGTMLSALALGLPQVLLPLGADQYQNAGIMLRAGAARCLMGDGVSATAVADAVSAVLDDGPERHATARLQAEIAAMPSPAEVARSLVEG